MPKQVTLSDECKAHDGLSSRQAFLDWLLSSFFLQRINLHESAVIKRSGGSALNALQLFQDLSLLVLQVKRLEQEAWTPALPRGGGKAIKLYLIHLPYLVSLVGLVKEVTRKMYNRKYSKIKPSLKQQPAGGNDPASCTIAA
jgi:hypothetical protein